jgi:localization factor PodJL
MPMTPPNERRGAHADTATSQDEQATYLLRMHERLAELSTEAGSIRAQLPHDYEQDVESIQQQMEFLGDRLAELNAGSAAIDEATEETLDAGWAAYRDTTNDNAGVMAGHENRVSRTETKFEQYDVTASSNTLEPADLWDEASVAELVRLYDSGEARLGAGPLADAAAEPQQAAAPEASSPSWSTANKQGGSASIEPAWLEQRFADIAQRIEQSLDEIRPESSLLKLGHRFDQLEERIISALDEVATRADIEELCRAEVQVEEISAQLGQFRDQLSRLDTIDAHLGTLTQQLSEEKITELLGSASSPAIDPARFDAVDAQLASIAEKLTDERFNELVARPATPMRDVDDLAASVAEQVAERFANHERWETQSRDLGEVRGLVENLMTERRINDENNVSMLETMQQAIIRVLDRIEGSEITQPSAAPTMTSSELAPDEAEPAQVSLHTDNDDMPSHVPVTGPEPGPAMAAEPMTSSEIETQPSSYESLTHPQPEPALEAEVATSSPSETQESTFVSLTHPQPEPESESSLGEALADLNDEMMYEPPPFLRSEDRPSDAAPANGRQDEPYASQWSPPVSEGSPLASSAFFGDTSVSELGAESQEIGSSKPAPLSIDQMRQKFIAEAHQAKLRAESAQEGMAGSENPIAANNAGQTAKTKRVSSKLGGTTMPSASMSSRVVLVGVLVLLIIVSTIFFLRPQSSPDTAGVPPPDAVHSIPDPRGEAGSGKGLAPKQTNKLLPGAGQKGKADKDAGDQAPNASPARVDTASIPHGIMLLEHREPNTDEIERVQQAQGMAFLSNQLGKAAANVTPASLMQEYILAQHSGPNRPNSQALTGVGNSLKLPPVTIGPFSLRLAAAQGVASAQFEVAARLAKGDVTEQNLNAASRWYQRSASQGFAMAQYRLGTLYERGLGVKADLARAQIWYRRAAQQGNLKAMHNLAVLSAGGNGRTADYTAAVQWFLQAAARGLADSQYNIAMLYESGLGVPHDMKQAYKWLVLASKSGDVEAKRHLKNLSAQLNKTDRAEAEKLAGSWRAKASDPMVNDAQVAGRAWQRSAQRAARG